MKSDQYISVCLLSYNHAHMLETVISSILNQSYKNFELIISDDNSTDDSWKIISEFASKFNFINAYKTPYNLGMAGNANFAISKAKNDFVALLHHDDLLNKDLLDEWLAVMLKFNNIGFVFNDYLIGGKSASNYKIKKRFSTIMDGKWFLKNELLVRFNCYVRGTALIRKRYFDEIGRMNEKFGMLADVDLWMRLSANWDVGYVEKPLIEVLGERPKDYPKEYSDFTWKRIFIGFDIHSNNINRINYPNYFQYQFKRFVFRNKVSFEIIKWHLYAILRKKYNIISSYSFNSNLYEYFYSRIFRKISKLFVKE